MSGGEGNDRSMLLVGLLPLVVGAVWLVLLRQPQGVAAYGARDGARSLCAAGGCGPADERSAVAPSEARFLGVVVAGREAELGAELAGQVVRVFAEPGARVRRGEPLIQLAALSVLGV